MVICTSKCCADVLGLSETKFQVTRKDYGPISGQDGFRFDESFMFIPGTTVVLLNLTALAGGLIGLQPGVGHGEEGSGLGEVTCSICVILCFWPFVRAVCQREVRDSIVYNM